jgi:serine phosphatase RsbU (regulator of sigma subunit)
MMNFFTCFFYLFKRLFLVLFFGALGWMSLHAQYTQVKLDAQTDEYLVGRWVDRFDDPDGKLSLEDVKKQKFFPSTQDVINLGFNTQTHWLRLIVNNDANHRETDWVVSVNWPVLSYIDFYDGSKVYQAGEARNFDVRPVKYRDFVFPITIKPGASDTFYIKIKSYTPNVYPITLETKEQWRVNNVLDDILLSAFFGAVVIMIIYNVLLFLSVNDNSYIPYILYITFFAVLITGMRGVAKQYIAPDWYWLNTMCRNGMAAAAGFCIGWFARKFLNLKQIAPKLDKVLLYSQYVWVTIFVLVVFNIGPLFPYTQVTADILLNVFAAIHPIIAFSAGIVAWRRGYKPAKYYVFGFSFLLGGIVIQVLKNLGVFNQNIYTEYTFQYGALIEQALLSIALGDKINVIKDQKEAAQREAIRALTENERIISEQNQILEIKVEERTRELNEANNELVQLNEELKQTLDYISHQNEIIEEKNRDITESIQYAWRIQNAILPDIDNIRKYIPEFFVFYRPKDIVSGDFFWFARNEEKNISFVATVDCTGHGVPGAFMSVIGYNVLNRVVIESGVTDTAAILTALDKGVRASLKQDQAGDKKTHDGMDLTLCAIHHNTKQVFFTGAQTTLYRLHNGEIEIIKGDKFPVGGAQADVKIFTSIEVPIEAGDRIYMYTDGIVDQFGGPQRRKFTPKRLQQMILDLQGLPVSQQLEPVTRTLDEWKGNVEQIDDMSLMSFQLL